MKQRSSRPVDFNSILMSLNVVVMLLIVYGFAQMGESKYVNQETIVLAVLLCIQTQVALWLERKQRDPFVILLAFIMICYFSFRIFTLNIYSVSLALARFDFSADDSNYAMIFILIANIFLYAGLYAVRFRGSPSIEFEKWRATTPGRAILLVLFAIVFNFTKDRYWTVESIPRALYVLVIFASTNVIILLAFAYWLAFAKSSSRLFTFTILALLMLSMLLETLAGSRGAIVVLIQQLMAVTLAIAGCIKVRKKHLVSGLLLVPGVMALLVGTFAISTFIRTSRGAATFNVGEAIKLARESDIGPAVLPPLFDRAGYFDYTADIIVHRAQYDQVISLSSYAKSIIDNLLTPGFDFFDQPRISQSLKFAYFGMRPASKIEVGEEYHSDQLGIHGELYALFGWASLPLFFGLAFLVKRTYVRLRGKNPFDLVLKRIVVLVIFGWLINSYGFDWILIDTLVFAAGLVLYRVCFRNTSCAVQEEELPRAAVVPA